MSLSTLAVDSPSLNQRIRRDWRYPPGDQTGHRNPCHFTYYNRPWKYYLRYIDYLEGFDNMTADEVRAIMCGGGILVRAAFGPDLTSIHTDLSNEAAWNRTNFERIYERLDRIEELGKK